jgi:hypothetical protein
MNKTKKSLILFYFYCSNPYFLLKHLKHKQRVTDGKMKRKINRNKKKKKVLNICCYCYHHETIKNRVENTQKRNGDTQC